MLVFVRTSWSNFASTCFNSILQKKRNPKKTHVVVIQKPTQRQSSLCIQAQIRNFKLNPHDPPHHSSTPDIFSILIKLSNWATAKLWGYMVRGRTFKSPQGGPGFPLGWTLGDQCIPKEWSDLMGVTNKITEFLSVIVMDPESIHLREGSDVIGSRSISIMWSGYKLCRNSYQSIIPT